MTRTIRPAPPIAKILAVLGALALAGLSANAAVAQEDEPKPRLMSLTGQGKITAAPDMAVLSLGVVSQDKTARQALFANSRAMAALVDAMKKSGIEAKDLQTSGFTVSPVYSRPRRSQGDRPPPPEIVGYSVRNMLSVRIRKLDTVGEILDTAVSLGSNTISGLSFTVAEPKPLHDAARQAAMADALQKATLYAEAAGVTLGAIQSISEGGVVLPPPIVPMARAQAEVAFDAAVPVEAGELTFRAQVSVVWEIGG